MVLFVSLLTAGTFSYTGLVAGNQFVLLFIAILMYGLSQIGIGLAISTLFSDPRMAMQLGFFFLTVPMVIFILCMDFNATTPEGHFPNYMYAFFWLPQFPLAVAASNMKGANLEPKQVYLNDGAAWAFLVLDVVIWLGLFLWMDQVIPDTYGIAKHPCFCLKKKTIQVYSRDHGSFASNDAAIKIKKLTKKFGQFVAVDNLNLDIKQNEIMALLGHNGAGKTTAIYMLTGLYKPDSGDATVYGSSLVEDIDGVRQSIGLCLTIRRSI